MSPNPQAPQAPGLPRAVRPDAETPDSVLLVKNVPRLRATYQVRMLAFLAGRRGKRLELRVPRGCRFDPALEALIREGAAVITRENLP